MPEANERLATIEADLKSVGRTLDRLNASLETHMEHGNKRSARIEALERDFSELRGAAKLFIRGSAVVMVLVTGVWAVATWVANHGVAVK